MRWLPTFRNLNNRNASVLGRIRMCSSASPVNIQINEKTGISTVTMQRPPVNALNLALIQALRDAFCDLSANKSRGVILTSSHPTVFSAGLDLKVLFGSDRNYFKTYWYEFQDLCLSVYNAGIPTAAAMIGHSPAGGCVLGLCCEYRTMVSGNFQIGLNETQVGIPVPEFIVDMFRNTVGSNGRAETALTAGKMFTVEEALEMKLIDAIAPNKDAAILQCEEFLLGFEKVDMFARNVTIGTQRRFIAENMRTTKEKWFEIMASFIYDPETGKPLRGHKK